MLFLFFYFKVDQNQKSCFLSWNLKNNMKTLHKNKQILLRLFLQLVKRNVALSGKTHVCNGSFCMCMSVSDWYDEHMLQI